MENYIVSARKYRPSTFASVVGQKALTATLRNSIAQNKLAHAYLFTGSRGVGKTSCARIFAKTINCKHRTPQGEACNECDSCREFNRGNSLNIVELDAASNNGVDAMHELIQQVQVPPVNAQYRVFIVDEVHMLSNAAFNAFLKTLEEPPAYVIFILATTEKHKIIPTILSRCQIYDFNRITIQDIVEHLTYIAGEEGVSVEPEALNAIARKADGGMRDALSIFDQVVASTMGNVTYAATIDNLNMLDYTYYDRLVEAFLSGNVPEALLIYKEIREKGFDSQFFINGMAQHFRDLMVASDERTLPLLEATDEAKAHMSAVAAKCSPKFLYRAMDLCSDADLNYRLATNKQFLVELTLIKLCQADSPSPGNSGADEGQLRPITPMGQAPQQTYPDVAPRKPQSVAGSASAPAVTPQHTAPVASTPPPPARATTKMRRPSTLSINGVARNDAGGQSDTAGSRNYSSQANNNAFTDEQMQQAWQKIQSLHPSEVLLANAMRNGRLERADNHRFTFTVESELIRDSVNSHLAMVVGELRGLLHNDSVCVDIVLDKATSSVNSMTDNEVYNLMRQNNPYIDVLSRDLGLKLM